MDALSFFLLVYSIVTLLFPPQPTEPVPLSALVATTKIFPIEGHSSITVVFRKTNVALKANGHILKAEFDLILGLPPQPSISLHHIPNRHVPMQKLNS
jgi:hypothetical protein